MDSPCRVATAISSTPIASRSRARPAREKHVRYRPARANASTAGSPARRASSSAARAASAPRGPGSPRDSIATVARRRARTASGAPSGSATSVRSAAATTCAATSASSDRVQRAGHVERADDPGGELRVAELLGRADRRRTLRPHGGQAVAAGQRQRAQERRRRLQPGACPRRDHALVGGRGVAPDIVRRGRRTHLVPQHLGLQLREPRAWVDAELPGQHRARPAQHGQRVRLPPRPVERRARAAASRPRARDVRSRARPDPGTTSAASPERDPRLGAALDRDQPQLRQPGAFGDRPRLVQASAYAARRARYRAPGRASSGRRRAPGRAAPDTAVSNDQASTSTPRSA